MTDPAAGRKNPWHTIHTFLTRKLLILQVIANLAGAGIVTSYFMFFDTNSERKPVKNNKLQVPNFITVNYL